MISHNITPTFLDFLFCLSYSAKAIYVAAMLLFLSHFHLKISYLGVCETKKIMAGGGRFLRIGFLRRCQNWIT